MSKGSDINVGNIEDDVKILNNFCEFEDAVVLTDYALTLVQEAIINILAEREQMLKERDVANDSVIAHKFAVMQQQLEQKDKRIKELEEESASKQKAYDDCYCNYKHYKQFESIPMQVVIDKMEELNKEIKSCDEIDAIFKIKQQQILQELLEGEKNELER